MDTRTIDAAPVRRGAAGTPVIAVGAGSPGDDVVEAVAAGVRAYLGRQTTAADPRNTVKRVHAGAAVIDPRSRVS